MKPAIFFSLGALALASAPAFAQEAPVSDAATGLVNITGEVARLCALGEPSVVNVDLGQLIDTSGARVGRLTSIGQRQVELPVFCNYAGTRLTVTSEALISADSTDIPAGFARAVNFTADVTGWATTPAQVTTAANADGSNRSANGFGGVQGPPKASDLTVALSNFSVPSDNYLTAGSYAGTVTVTVGPGELETPQ